MKNYRPTAKRWILTMNLPTGVRVMVGDIGQRKWTIYRIDTKPVTFRTFESAMVARRCSRFAKDIKCSEVYV